MEKKKRTLFAATAFVLCVLLFLERWTGGIFHAILGIFLIVLVLVHTCRRFGKMKLKKISLRLVDWILLISLAALFVTGLLLHPMHGVLIIKILHKLAALLFLLGTAVHLVQHR